ncbi:hypothetical protein, partial [Paraburkholderia tagetis]
SMLSTSCMGSSPGKSQSKRVMARVYNFCDRRFYISCDCPAGAPALALFSDESYIALHGIA